MTDSNIQKRSLGKKLLYVTVLFLLICFLAESLLSIVYYHRFGGSPFALAGLAKTIKYKLTVKEDRSIYYQNQQLVRPDSPAIMNQQIADEAIEANGFDYQPWLGFSAKSYQGKYLHINGLIRATIPDATIDTNRTEPILIYFLGGSTMFGFNVADQETIPSYFVSNYLKKKFKAPIKVVNYAIPAYYSYHELVLMTQLMFDGKRPDLVVFFDGLNDFIAAQASPFKKPLANYRMAQAFSMDIRRGNPLYQDSMDFVFQNSPGSSIQALSDSMYQNYISTISSIEKIAATYHAVPYFFVQPVPYFNYPHQKNDPICSKLDYPQYQYIYPKLEQESLHRNNLFFFGNLLATEKGINYVDKFHYAPRINEKIAVAMLEKLVPAIDSLAARRSVQH